MTLERILGIRYDKDTKKLSLARSRGRDFEFGGGSSIPYGKKIGRQTTVEIVAQASVSGEQTLDLDAVYNEQDDIGLSWNSSTKRFDCQDGGSFLVESGVYIDAAPSAAGGAYSRLAGDGFTTIDPPFSYNPTVQSAYGKQWTAADLQAGLDWFGLGSVVIEAGGDIGFGIDPGDVDINVNYAYLQFTRIG